MMTDALFTAVVITGGPPRPEKTARSMRALNDQTFASVQKILINNARPDSEIEYFRSIGALTSEWEVINFLSSAYILGDTGSVWREPGKKALGAAVGRYIFFQSDDDFLASDFFTKMDGLFKKHPDAVCGVGLPISYFWDSNQFIRPGKGSWQGRPTYESGRELVRKHLGDDGYTINPGFSLVMATEKVRDVSATIFEAGFPDWNCLYQVALRGHVVFDPTAEMYWGRHKGQDHKRWNDEHILTSFYRATFASTLEHNLAAMQKFVPHSEYEQKAIRSYFRKNLAEISAQILFDRLLQKLRIIPISEALSGKSIDVIGHLALLSRAPVRSAATMGKAMLITLRGGLKKLVNR